MKRQHMTPLKTFRGNIADIVAQFSLHDGITVDPETGIMHMPEGFARLAYHRPTNTVSLLVSKDQQNLTGRKKEDGSTVMTTPQMDNVKIIASYRGKGSREEALHDHSNYKNIIGRLTEDLKQYRSKQKDRCEKHFTLYGVDLKNGTYVYTNGRIIYAINKKKKGYEIRRYKPTLRKEGSFVAFDLSDKSLRGRFNRISAHLATLKKLEDVQDFIHKDWQQMMQILQNEEDMFKNDSYFFRRKAELHRGVDRFVYHLPKRLFTIAAVSMGMHHIKPEYTIPVLVATTAIHTGMDIIAESAFDAYAEGRERAKESSKKPTIDHYEYGDNATFLFRKQDHHEINKVEADIDQERFPAPEWEWLDAEDMSLANNEMRTAPYKHAGSIEEYTLYLHRRGVGSKCHIIDNNTLIHYFENGIVRLMHYDAEKQKYKIYAQHYRELCSDKKKALPLKYRDQIKSDLITYEYQEFNDDFSKGLITPAQRVTQDQSINSILSELTRKKSSCRDEEINRITERLREIFQDAEERKALFSVPMPFEGHNLGSSANDSIYAPNAAVA